MGVMAVGAIAFSMSHTYAHSVIARCLLGAGAGAAGPAPDPRVVRAA